MLAVFIALCNLPRTAEAASLVYAIGDRCSVLPLGLAKWLVDIKVSDDAPQHDRGYIPSGQTGLSYPGRCGSVFPLRQVQTRISNMKMRVPIVGLSFACTEPRNGTSSIARMYFQGHSVRDEPAADSIITTTFAPVASISGPA